MEPTAFALGLGATPIDDSATDQVIKTLHSSCCKKVSTGETYRGDIFLSIIDPATTKRNPYFAGLLELEYDEQPRTVYSNLIENQEYQYAPPRKIGKEDQLIDYGHSSINIPFSIQFKPTPGLTSLLNQLKDIKRSIVMGPLINDLAENYLINQSGEWTRLIKAEENLQSTLTSAPHGPTASEISKWIIECERECERECKGRSDQQPIQNDSCKKLKNLGFPKSFGKDSKSRAIKAIALLERFYVLAHLDLIHFQQANDLPVKECRYKGYRDDGATPMMPCGMDFNEGRKAVWSKDDQLWHLIDY